MTGAVVIAALMLDDDSFRWLDGLRRKHFPPARNVLHAHLTLFHHLDATQADAMRAVACREAPMALSFSGVRFLGRGVAVDVASDALLRFRKTLMDVGGAFTAQDRQPFRPHVTVQNKAAPDEARALYETLRAEFVPREGIGTGLALWTYRGGPWELRERIAFVDAS